MAKTCPFCHAVCYFDLAKFCVQCGHRFGESTGSGILEMFKNVVKECKNEKRK
jgi:hypothetical protein